MDYVLFRLINGLAGRWPVVDAVMRFFATDYVVPTTMICALVFVWFSGRRVLQRQALLAILSVAISNTIVAAFNAVWFRPRPFTTHDDVTLLFYHPSDSSFPANSSATTWALAWAVWLIDRRIGSILVTLAFMMALARVFVGVHYPFDVIAGAMIGIGAARAVARWLAPHLRPALQVLITIARRLRLA